MSGGESDSDSLSTSSGETITTPGPNLTGSSMSSKVYGKIPEFKLNSDDFEAWVEQFEAYVSLNKISDNDRFLLFTTSIGNEAYVLLKTLCTPQKPSDKGYEDVKKLLQEYITPKPNKRAERYKFRDRRQNDTESISQYLAELKKLSTYCEFTDLEDNLLDQLIWGCKSQEIKKRLFAEQKLTYTTCVELALAMEAAQKDTSKLHSNATSLNYSAPKKKQFNPTSAPKSGSSRSEKPNNKDSAKCPHCTRKNHDPNNCFHKNSVCNLCKVKGHITPACNQFHSKKKNVKTNPIHNLSYLETQFRDLGLDIDSMHALLPDNNVHFIKPFVVNLKVNDMDITFEKDSGSPISGIADKDMQLYNLHEKPLHPTTHVFKSYTGGEIKPRGFLKVQVTYNDVSKLLDLYVFEKGGPPLAGRDWILSLKIEDPKDIVGVEPILKFEANDVDSIVAQYPEVFSDNLGCYRGESFKLHLKDNVKPIFFKPRPLPFSIRKKVTAELERLQQAKLISPVDSSEWGTPIVPVTKPNGSIRLCGDYKVTLNANLAVDKFPVPRIQDILVSFDQGAKFCKLDLSQAYLQLKLHESSKQLTTISTHVGLFVWNRLPYGIASSPGIFCRVVHNLLIQLPGVVSFFDDILISGKDDAELSARLKLVLDKLKARGLTLQRSKCQFFVDKVQFLGYQIDASGVRIPELRVMAIRDMPVPRNVDEVKHFLGIVSHYARFVPRLATLATPLYYLTRKDVKWRFGPVEMTALSTIKQIILSDQILTHFNTNLPLILTTDASPVGVSAILSHEFPNGQERPIAFASRGLSPAEVGYSQIDREALALVFGVKYFHQYVYGREFILRTDNRAVSFIFNEHKGIPVMSAQRVQRYAVFLAGYHYKLIHVSASQITNVDALSRLPLPLKDSINHEASDKFYINALFEDLPLLPEVDVAKFVKEDATLREVFLRVYFDDWPHQESDVPEQLRVYFRKRQELTIENGCLLWGHRIIIPTALRPLVLRELHSTHLGVVKMKNLARSHVYWPSIDSDIEKITANCQNCLINRDEPGKAVLHSWPWPDGPAHRVHVDFVGPVHSKMYLVMIDAHSKWLYVQEMKNITTEETIKVFREYFSRWGVPMTIVSDNGTSFCSHEMEDFLRKNGVLHVRTAPYHPASNGAAENAVRTFKKFLYKCSSSGPMQAQICEFLLSYNSTPHCSTGVSPAELHIGRKLYTALDRLSPKFRAAQSYSKRLAAAAKHFRGSRDVEFKPEESVWVRNYAAGAKFVPGQVENRLSPVTYSVKVGNSVMKRHSDQLIRAKTSIAEGSAPMQVPEISSPSPSVFPAVSASPAPVAPATPVKVHSEIRTEAAQPVVEIRKSGRARKPVDRLNL